MITVKHLMQSGAQASPNGEHWEPAVPHPPMFWLDRLRDAWAVYQGNAIAIRQTTKVDVQEQTK
jgi:hypothetical protein